MSRKHQEREQRKQLLKAYSNLHRIEIEAEWQAISARLPFSGREAAGGGFSWRSWLVSTLLGRVAGFPVARILGVASGVLAFAKVLSLGRNIWGNRAEPSEEGRPGPVG
jgi:hypothetical protein